MSNNQQNNRRDSRSDSSGKSQNLSERPKSNGLAGDKYKGHVASGQPPLRPKPKQ